MIKSYQTELWDIITTYYFIIFIQNFHLNLKIFDHDPLFGGDDVIAVMDFSTNITPDISGSSVSKYTQTLADGTAT